MFTMGDGSISEVGIGLTACAKSVHRRDSLMAWRRLRDAGALPPDRSINVSNASDLSTLVRNEARAREQAEASSDVSARIAHLERAAGYAKMIKALKQ